MEVLPVHARVAVFAAALTVSSLLCLSGCKTRSAAPVAPSGPPNVTAAELPIELTYPQSDDLGHCVALKKSGSYVVSGIVASPTPPTLVRVNGISTRPAAVSHITPYGAASQYPVYRFYAPLVLEPTDRVVVQVVEPVVSREVVFAPDTVAVVRRYTALTATYPRVYWPYYRLGSAYYADLQYAQAVSYLNRALNYEKDAPWVLYDLGMSYLSWRRADDALRTFDRGLAVYPAFPYYYYGRGLVYYTTRRYDTAIVDLVRASDLAPDWGEPLLALGLTYYVDRRLNDARVTFYRTADLWPYWAPPRYALADVLLDEDDARDAVIVLGQAERLGPWRADQHLALAEKLAARGNSNAAWRQVQIARKLGGAVPGSLVTRLRAKERDPGNLGGQPWAAMLGPRGKPQAERVWRPGRGAAESAAGPGPGGRQPLPKAPAAVTSDRQHRGPVQKLQPGPGEHGRHPRAEGPGRPAPGGRPPVTGGGRRNPTMPDHANRGGGPGVQRAAPHNRAPAPVPGPRADRGNRPQGGGPGGRAEGAGGGAHGHRGGQ